MFMARTRRARAEREKSAPAVAWSVQTVRASAMPAKMTSNCGVFKHSDASGRHETSRFATSETRSYHNKAHGNHQVLGHYIPDQG
jgi:hypothetical protein